MTQEIPGTHLICEFAQKAFITKDGKVLMCLGFGSDHWDFPGGRLHTKEDPTEGLKRELMEELGVEAEIGEPFFMTVWYVPKIPRVLLVYLTTLTNPQAEFVVAADEIKETKWVSKDDIETLGIAPEWKPALYKFFAQH